MSSFTRFIDLFAGHIQKTREIDVETKLSFMIFWIKQ